MLKTNVTKACDIDLRAAMRAKSLQTALVTAEWDVKGCIVTRVKLEVRSPWVLRVSCGTRWNRHHSLVSVYEAE